MSLGAGCDHGGVRLSPEGVVAPLRESPGQTVRVVTIDSPAAEQLLHRLRVEQAVRRLPSVCAAIVRGGQTVWTGGAGIVDDQAPTADTQYRIGSITKTFVAVAVMRLRDAGLLALDDPVTDHLGPEWNVAVLANVRTAQLLMHSAGVPAETSGPWWERTPGIGSEELVRELAEREAPLVGGQRFHYSNVGFAVLGAVLEHHRRSPWHRVVHEEILVPLGMRRTSPRPQPPFAPGLAVHPWADVVLREPEHDAGVMAPAGQLWSTLDDLGRWMRFLAGDTAEVLSADTLEEMCVPGPIEDLPHKPWTTAHGLGLQVFNDRGNRTVGHGGSMPGFLAGIRVDRETGTGVGLATNTTAGLDPALGDDLLALLDRHAPAPPPPWRPATLPDGVSNLVGVWYWGPRPLVMNATAGQLTLAPLQDDGRASAFQPDGQDRWLGLHGYFAGEHLQVLRGPDGEPTHLNVASFVLTRQPYGPAEVIPGGVDPAGWR